MAEHIGTLRVVELDTLDRHGGRALMVHLPSTDGRSRVAFVPAKAAALLMAGLTADGLQARLLEELLTT